MTALIVAVVVLSIALIAVILLLLSRRPQDYTQAFTLLQQRVGQIEEQVKRSVDEGGKTVNEKFESSLKVIGDIKKQIGSLEETNKQMVEIGKNIAGLQEILRPPQVRGGFGELTLGNMLMQVLPRQNYEEQHRFKNGSIVDAAVKLGDRWVPIDSKFPLEGFQRYIQCCEDDNKKTYLREFERSVRTKIDDISSKYILEDEGTYDFALMYIPSENVYYQCILKEESKFEGKSISDYALEKRVVPVSPNTLYAYLQVICLGLRGMQVEKQSHRILADLSRLRKEFEKFEDEFHKLGSHLRHAGESFGRADRQLENFSGRIAAVGGTSEVVEIEKAEEDKLLDS
ncbi:MAG: DNA recombination protein RmuC [Chloroflexi bacterium]|nr:DNA recombination protein RmuC [Chloroflexota bacterium]